MNLECLDKIDSKKMYQTYDKWPEISKNAFQKEFEKLNVKNINHIVFAGMGGSGTIGDVISAILSKDRIHLTNVKGYLLPATTDSETLVVVTSVSGNTDETLTILEKANNSPAKVAAFGSGGVMEKYCKENQIFFQKIPVIHSPRASFTNFLFSILNILESIIPVKKSDILESISILEKTRDNIFSGNLTAENQSLKLANYIKQTPCIYYPAGLKSAAIRFKNSLQENAKMHVISEDAIEACHNGVVAWEQSSSIQPILIEGYDDYFKTKERWQIIKELFDNYKISYYSIKSNEDNILSKIIHLIYLLDYASIYVSVLRGIDPSPVNSIDFIKNKLNQ